MAKRFGLLLAGALAVWACEEEQDRLGAVALAAEGSDGASNSADCNSDSDDSDSDASTGENPIDRLFASVGGTEVLAGFNSVAYEATGVQRVHSEARLPGDLLEANTFQATVRYRHQERQLRTDEARDTQFPFALPRMFTRRLEGDAGWTEGLEGLPVLLPPGDIDPDKAAGHAWMQELIVPHILLRRALDGEVSVMPLGTVDLDGMPHDAFQLDTVLPVQALVDACTGRLGAIQMTVHDTLKCDEQVEVRFSDWRAVGEHEFPFHVDLRGFGGTVHSEDRSGVELDTPIADDVFAFPPEATLPTDSDLAETGRRRFPYYHFTSAMGVPFSLNQDMIEATPLAPGVFFLVATHNTLVVEQKDRVIVIEAPLDVRRSGAILDWVASEFAKPISHVIATHHHLDHAAGLRRFVAEGATVVLAEQGEAFFRDEVVTGPCTVLPDELAQDPIDPVIEAVSREGSLTLDDPQNPIRALQVETDHAQDMLIVYLPNQGLLFNADLYNPLIPELEGLITPFFREIEIRDLARAIDQFGLTPAAIVGGHGSIATFEQFTADLEALDQ